MSKIKAPHLPFIWLSLVAGLSLFSIHTAVAQTRNYLSGQKTGNRIQVGALIGTAKLSAPMLSHTWGCALGAQTNEFRYYYGDVGILNEAAATPTKLTASRAVLGLSGGDVYVQFRNAGNAPIAANTSTYFKLKERPSNVGITINVSGLLGLTELNSVSGTAYTGATDYVLNTATLGFLSCPNPYNGAENPGTVAGTSSTQLLLDAAGEWYAKVTPNASYNAVRLKVAFPAALELSVATEINVNVYHAFTLSAGSSCSSRPIFTSPGEATGINLNTSALGLGLNDLLANPQAAINSNKNDYSAFTTGIANVGVASTISQTFYFDHTAASTDAVTFKFGLTQALVDLNLLGNGVSFSFYNGNTQVGSSQTLADNLIGLNLLNLISLDASYKQADVSIKPTSASAFDRVVVTYNTGLINANVIGDALRIYDVNLTAAKPTFAGLVTDNIIICTGKTAELGAITESGNQLLWYESLSSTTPIQTLAYNQTFTSPVLTADKTYYVSAKKCGEESGRVPVKINVHPILPLPIVTVISN